MSEKTVILPEEITSSQADTESVVGSAGTHFAISINLHVRLKKKLLWRWAGRVRVEFRNRLLLEIMAKLVKLRGGRHTSRVRMSRLFVVLPRWRFLGLSCRVSFSQKLSEKRSGRTDFVWGCFWHPSTFAMWVFISWEFTINLSIRFSFLASHLILISYLCCARWNLKMTWWRYCVLVYNCSGEPFVHPDISGTSRIDVLGSEFDSVAPTSEHDVRKGGSKKDLSRLFLRVKICLICIVDLFLGQWFKILVFAGDAEIAPRVSGRDSVSTEWRLMVILRYATPLLPDA